MSARRRAFGYIRQLPSGRYQAAFLGTDGQRHTAPMTYAAKIDAQKWLTVQEAAIATGAYLLTRRGKARAGDAYALLHAILATAIAREYREAANSCRRGD